MSKNKEQLLELLDKDGDSLYGLLFRLTLSAETAEDLMQELFVRLLSSANIGDVRRLYFYARKTAINLAFDRHRRLKRTRLTGESPDEPVGNAPTPLQELLIKEQHRQLLEAVSKLKNPYRDIIVLRFIEQQPYESIAEQMGETAHKIRAVCSKGIRKLRVLLDGNRILSEERKKDVRIR